MTIASGAELTWERKSKRQQLNGLPDGNMKNTTALEMAGGA